MAQQKGFFFEKLNVLIRKDNREKFVVQMFLIIFWK